MGFFDFLNVQKPKPEPKTIEEFNQQIKDETAEYNRVKSLGLPAYDVAYLPGVGYRDHSSKCPVCNSNLKLSYRKAHRHILITCSKKCGYEYVKTYDEICD